MASRGIWHFMSARTRRGLALSWSALFVLSLLLQYFSFALAAPALAAHDVGLFELDGNATDQAAAGADWQNGAEGSADQFFAGANTEASANDVTYFTTGGSKDENDIPSWAITDTSVPDKDQLTDAYAAVYQAGGDTWVYFGADRFDNDGDAQIGFWFFQGNVGIANGDFTGKHVDGDVLILSEYTNGGVVDLVCAYEWDGSGGGSNIAAPGDCDPATSGSNLNLVAAGAACDTADGTYDICAVTNEDTADAPWTFVNKDGETDFATGQFFEGGINLSDMFGGQPPCFGTFLAETRSSQETDAQLKDFAFGSLNTCVPPTITTTSSAATADFGASVTDTATLSGSNGNASGTVAFFICTPSQITAAGCPEGAGNQVGSAVAVNTAPNPDTATSAAYVVGVTAAAAGKYCWRAEYTPDAASQYLADTHTNATTECFTVAPATIDIEKTANPVGPVSAGSDIGFDITVTNSGTQTTLGVSVSDPLPAGIVWTADAPTGSTTGVSCSINTAPSPDLLTCTDASMPAGASFTVHIHGTTDSADCGTVNNTASVATSNDGSDSDPASVVVECPDVTVEKTPDNGSVQAGSTATFTIVVTNLGPGSATSVTLTDNLPAGYVWTLGGADAASCSIDTAPAPDVLSCNFGTLADDATRTITLSAPTTGANCAVIPNTATVAATNEATAQQGNNSNSGSIDVLCANVGIVKTANPVGPVSAGSDIGFDFTVTNSGDGTATSVSVSDPLPAGIVWTVDAPTGDTTGVSCSIDTAPSPDLLTCTDASMPAGAAFTVHIHGTTDSADCGTVSNTATVSTGNDGGGSSTASVVVQCPDLEVTKVAVDGTISAGDVAQFTILVKNWGPGTALNVHVEDDLPAGVTWTISPAVVGCSIDTAPAPDVLSCDFASLASGASVEISIQGDTVAANCGTLHNEVVVSASNENTETDQFPNSDEADIVVDCPTIVLTKTADAGTVNAGDSIGFTIEVSNTGLGNATSVLVTDSLPAGITWTADAPTGDTTGVSCSIDTVPSPDVLTCTDALMGPGDSFSVHIHGTTDSADCGVVNNTAVVTTGNDGGDDDIASVTVQCPDVTVVKTPDAGTVNAGSNAVFTIVVSNSNALGTGTAYDVTLTDNLPAGYVWTVGGADGEACDIDTEPSPDVLSCDFGDLDAGESRTITLTAPTSGANCAVIPNTADVAASNEDATDLDNNSDDASIDVTCALIDIEKVANPAGPVNAGDSIGFDISVSNNGDGTATGVVVTDNLPSGIDWTLGAISGDSTGVECEISGAVGSEVLTCTDASLAVEGSFSVHVSGLTDAADCGTVSNTASVSTTNDGSDSDSASVDVLCPDIEVIKDATNTPIPVGQDLVFTIKTTNLGEGVAYDVVLSDTLPVGFDWAVDNEDCAIAAGVLTCDFGDMAPDASITVTLTAPTSGDPDTGNIDCAEDLSHTIPNVASATAGNEGEDVLDNNEDDATIIVNCSALVIDKSFTGNTAGTDPDLDVPAANIGDILAYTLHYTGAGPITNAVITDVLPQGLDFVEGSPCTVLSAALPCATDDPNFVFVGYNDVTRTLTWTAATLPNPTAGDVTYDVIVLQTAPDFVQPLVNVATIDSDQTPSDTDTAEVSVLAPPLELTPPPTSTLTPQSGTSNPGFALMLILIGVAGLALGIGFVTPVPARVRRRDRLG
jgi:uncharacterized repeat protein (TIGR01451 family)